MSNPNIERARGALHAIPPSLPRAEWVRAGMGAHAAGLLADDFIDWSRPAPSFQLQTCMATWRSFKQNKGVGEGTLYRMAASFGWTDKGEAPPRPAPKSAPKPATPKTSPTPAMNPAVIWSRCEAATPGHAYIEDKGAMSAPLNGLRVVPAGDTLRIMGESMAGALVVPVLRPDGELASLQFITAGETAKRLKAKEKPTKLNLPGASVEGWYTVGELLPGGVAYLCEGIGTAWAAWMATGRAAVVCFGAGNMGKVAQALRLQDSTAHLVLCPDVGKEAQAQTIAAAVGGAVATMPEGWPNNSDLHDLGRRDGFDVVALLLDKSEVPPKREPRLKPVSVFDVLTRPAPPPAFVWADYIPCGVVTLMGAHGGTGKSTIALMLAVCAASGRSLFGAEVKPCKVLFASLEDSGDIVRHRLAHVCKLWNIDPLALLDRLHIVDGTESPELFCAEGKGSGELTDSYEELSTIVHAEGIGLVIVDNASDAYAGDEIQRRQVRAFIRALALAVKPNNAGCLLLSHVDKNTSKARKAEGGEGYSGSTAWHNSVRSRLFMTRGDDGLLTLEHQKSNLGRMREPITLEWAKDGLPQLLEQGTGFDIDNLTQSQQGRGEDEKAIALMRLIAEFESRDQYCSPVATARNNVFAMLKSEPAFQRLKLNADGCKRIVTQSQRAKWLEQMDYRTHDRKTRPRWTLTTAGRAIAGLSAPCAPSALCTEESAESAGGAPCAPSC